MTDRHCSAHLRQRLLILCVGAFLASVGPGYADDSKPEVSSDQVPATAESSADEGLADSDEPPKNDETDGCSGRRLGGCSGSRSVDLSVAACGRCCCCPCICWSAWGDALWLRRSSPDSQDLVFNDEDGPTPANPARLNAEDLDFEHAPGYRVGLLRHLDACRSFEINYFGVDSWMESATIFPPPDPLFVQYPGATVPVSGAVTFSNGTDLHSAEFNLRRRRRDWLTFLMGFRWVELHDRLTASSTLGTLYAIDADNHLYGPQIGFDALLWDRGGPVRVNSWFKTAVMYNNADQVTNEFVFGPVEVFDRDGHTAFLGDLGIAASVRLTRCLGVRFGYQLLWLEGVALAADQIPRTDVTVPVAMLDTNGGLFFDGAFVGLDLAW